jgi:DNA-binding LytR/AlgR family response regulator
MNAFFLTRSDQISNQTNTYQQIHEKPVAEIGMKAFGQIPSDTIIYMQAQRNYTLVKLINGGVIKVSAWLSRMCQEEQTKKFFRCHKAFAVNLSHLAMIEYKKQVRLFFMNGDIVICSERKRPILNKVMRSRMLTDRVN